MNADLLHHLVEQHAAEVERLARLLAAERDDRKRFERECRNLWAAFAIIRSGALAAWSEMDSARADLTYIDQTRCNNLHGTLDRADFILGIVDLEEADDAE